MKIYIFLKVIIKIITKNKYNILFLVMIIFSFLLCFYSILDADRLKIF